MTTKKTDKREALENIYEILKEVGYDEVILVGSKSGSKNEVISMQRVDSTTKGMALAGMAIKFLADEIDERSDVIAYSIADKLKETEEMFEKMDQKKEKKLNITISEG